MPTVADTTNPPTVPIPDVVLNDMDGVAQRLHDLLGTGPSVLAFVCNHCPYVQHIEQELARVLDEFRVRGVAAVAIMSNDLDSYPEDGPEGMRAQADRAGWKFPYLLDPEHEVAIALGAVCTPDLFVYDAARHLVHRGALDGSTPRNGEELTGSDLRAALEAVVAGTSVPEGLTPSLGCGIKWKDGLAPE